MTNLVGMLLVVLSVETNYPATKVTYLSCAETGCQYGYTTDDVFVTHFHTKTSVESNVVRIVTTIGAGCTPWFRLVDQRSDEKRHNWSYWRDGMSIERIKDQ